MIQNIEFVRNNRIVQELVLVDGLPRTGKSMLGPILSSFNRVEIERMEPILESIPLLYSFNKISKDAAVALLIREIDMKLHDSMISRNTNFRVGDHTGVFNNLNFIKYFKRLFSKEGDIVLERIKRERPIFQVQTHDMLQRIDLYLEAFGTGLSVIEMVRHPVDLVYSLDTRGHGSKIGVNPRLWQLAIRSKNGDIPYYASGWIDEYVKLSPIDRLINMAQCFNEEGLGKYESLSQPVRKQILFVPFEKFAVSPFQYMELISRLIGSKTTKQTEKALKRQMVPRQINLKEREKKLKSIKKRASREYLRILDSLSNEYESKYLNS